MAHTIVKPSVLAKTAAGLLEQELLIPNTFHKESVDQYKGAENDTINTKVPGVLPFHEYAWRNNRSQPLTFDEYSERSIAVSFGGNFYNGIKLTDEQADFDLKGWANLLQPQVKAVARGLGRAAVSHLTSAPYSVVIGDSLANLRGAIIEARRVLNKFNVPDEERFLLVGTDFEAALLATNDIALASNIGDSEADSMLKTATIGKRYGFTIVVDETIPSDAAYAYVRSAFVFANAAPSVPPSVPFGSSASFEGVSMRWIRDYDPSYLTDRSVVNTYAGFRSVDDILVGWNPATSGEVVGAHEHFVRGVKLVLDGASTYPNINVDADGAGAGAPAPLTWGTYEAAKTGGYLTPSAELALITGVTGPGAHLAGSATGTVAND